MSDEQFERIIEANENLERMKLEDMERNLLHLKISETMLRVQQEHLKNGETMLRVQQERNKILDEILNELKLLRTTG